MHDLVLQPFIFFNNTNLINEDKLVKRDLKDWDISEELALDRSGWRLAINVPEP